MSILLLQVQTAENHLKDALAESETIKTAASVSDAAKVALNSKLQQSSYNVAAATKEVTTSQSTLKTVTESWSHVQKSANSAIITADKSLGTYKESTLSVGDALAAVKKAEAEVKDSLALGDTAREQTKVKTEALEKAQINLNSSLATQKEEIATVSAVVNSLGDAFESMTGRTIKNLSKISSSFATLVTQIRNGTGSETNKTTGLSNTATSALSLASNVSGSGTFVNKVSTGATSGSSLANLFVDSSTGVSSIGISALGGGLIGAGISALSSIFGGGGASKQDVATAQSNASSGASSISSAASAGNSVAQEIMRRAGYSTTTLSVSSKMSDLSGMGLDQYMGTNVKDYGLFYTKENNYNATLTEAVTNIGKIESSINKFANASVVQTLSDIAYKWDTIEATVGVSADTAKARISEIFTSVLSLSADTVGTAVASAFSSYSGYSSAGEKAATTISDSLITSIQDMGLSTTISDIIMPLYEEALTPYLTKITSGIKLTVADYSEISSVISSLKTSTTETVNSIYDLYTESGLLTSTQKSTAAATSSLTTATTDLGTAATKTAAEIASERSTLLNSYYNLIGDTATTRASDLAALDETNRALQQSIWDITDANTAASAASTQASTDATTLTNAQATLASAQTTLTSSLKTQSDYVASLQTAADTAAYNAIQDAATAAATDLANAKTAVTDALSALKDSITTQKDALTAIYDAQKAAVDAQITAQNSLVSSISSISDSLHSALKVNLLYFRGQGEKSYLQTKGDMRHDTDRQRESQTVQQRV